MAARSSGKPIIGGYWFQPSTTASAALRRTSSGPGSSGKPCPRLTAPVSRASRDMTSNTVVGRSARIGFMHVSLGGRHLGSHLGGERVDGVGRRGAAADGQVGGHIQAPLRRDNGHEGRVREQGGALVEAA